ncbi:MAG: threonylcarbamoyl-AMP synthase [Bacteroidetes bacterium]|nr:MAG: threonylcarbamoyl-AMP synthase [Bacteroidota bacterium]
MNFDDDIEKCLAVLKTGGIILYPTDTIWGIGCDATNATAVEKIYEIKRRPENKSLIVLMADQREILKHVSHPDPAIPDYLKTLTKPTTVIYEGAIGLAENLVSQDGSVAIRLVNDIFCRHLIKRFRKPVVSTSANITGEPPPQFFDQVSDEIKEGVDYIVNYRQDDHSPRTPSAIIKWKNGGPELIRE